MRLRRCLPFAVLTNVLILTDDSPNRHGRACPVGLQPTDFDPWGLAMTEAERGFHPSGVGDAGGELSAHTAPCTVHIEIADMLWG